MSATAFTLFGTAVSWLECWAFATAVAGVVLCIAENHWGWPFAIVSSTLYGWLFAASRLYGEAALQVLFFALSAWGWWQWRFAPDPGGRAAGLVVRRIGRRIGWPLAAWVLLWPALAALLAVATDSDVPGFDAFTTSGSVVGQALLARKVYENWHVWIVVNLASVGLFLLKGLLLTAVLYALLAALAVAGLLGWRRRLAH